MRYLTYRRGGQERLGSLQQDYIVDVGQVAQIDNLLDLISAGPQVWQEVAETLKAANVEELASKGWAVPYQPGLVAAPISKPPKNVICLGRNYYKHFLEGAVARGSDEKPPEAPIYFTKPHTSIIGPFDPIPLDFEVTTQLDWEAEMGVIIGIGGRKINQASAMQHVFGYTVINDLSARDLQYRHQQWFRGKGLDASCPMGPVVVTPDELPDPVHVPIKLRVNGVTKQDANTGQLMFDVATCIADISMSLTLEPGDVISTGTPDGVGNFRKPPEFLQPGDIMETEVEGIGIMRNPIVTPEKAEIIAKYNRERDNLIALINRLQPQHYNTASVNPGWSVKDLVAHLTNSTASVQMLMQRQLDREPNAGVAALNERNAKGVESRKERTIATMVDELVREHQKNIDFFLGLSDEQLATEGALASGEVITVAERFRRAAKHYREHGEQIAAATGLAY